MHPGEAGLTLEQGGPRFTLDLPRGLFVLLPRNLPARLGLGDVTADATALVQRQAHLHADAADVEPGGLAVVHALIGAHLRGGQRDDRQMLGLRAAQQRMRSFDRLPQREQRAVVAQRSRDPAGLVALREREVDARQRRDIRHVNARRLAQLRQRNRVVVVRLNRVGEQLLVVRFDFQQVRDLHQLAFPHGPQPFHVALGRCLFRAEIVHFIRRLQHEQVTVDHLPGQLHAHGVARVLGLQHRRLRAGETEVSRQIQQRLAQLHRVARAVVVIGSERIVEVVLGVAAVGADLRQQPAERLTALTARLVDAELANAIRRIGCQRRIVEIEQRLRMAGRRPSRQQDAEHAGRGPSPATGRARSLPRTPSHCSISARRAMSLSGSTR